MLFQISNGFGSPDLNIDEVKMSYNPKLEEKLTDEKVDS